MKKQKTKKVHYQIGVDVVGQPMIVTHIINK